MSREGSASNVMKKSKEVIRVDRHVGKDAEYLKARDEELAKKPLKFGQSPPQASSYPDLKTAEEVTKKVIEGNRAEIEEWLKDDAKSRPKSFRLDLKREIGYGLRKGSNVLESKTGAIVVLKKIGKEQFAVLTSYPID